MKKGKCNECNTIQFPELKLEFPDFSKFKFPDFSKFRIAEIKLEFPDVLQNDAKK